MGVEEREHLDGEHGGQGDECDRARGTEREAWVCGDRLGKVREEGPRCQPRSSTPLLARGRGKDVCRNEMHAEPHGMFC